jgi:hypothetical protein
MMIFMRFVTFREQFPAYTGKAWNFQAFLFGSGNPGIRPVQTQKTGDVLFVTSRNAMFTTKLRRALSSGQTTIGQQLKIIGEQQDRRGGMSRVPSPAVTLHGIVVVLG